MSGDLVPPGEPVTLVLGFQNGRDVDDLMGVRLRLRDDKGLVGDLWLSRETLIDLIAGGGNKPGVWHDRR